MRVTFTRESLYQAVWSKPITSLAYDLGLSDRGLSRLCERHEIPVPSRGYWAKKAVGQRVEPEPLPLGEDETIVIAATPPKEVIPEHPLALDPELDIRVSTD